MIYFVCNWNVVGNIQDQTNNNQNVFEVKYLFEKCIIEIYTTFNYFVLHLFNPLMLSTK